MKRAFYFLPVAASAALISCSATSLTGGGNKALAKLSAFSARLRPTGVQVVEVREHDLKELPTGHEQALAFTQTRKRSFWKFDGPVNFVEPSLPEAVGEVDGSLLPPRDL